jgi:hypothetical protein
MDWRQAASMLMSLTPEARAGMVPSVESVAAALAVQLGWRWNGGPPIPLAALAVKAATELQLRPVVEARRAAHALFVGEV